MKRRNNMDYDTIVRLIKENSVTAEDFNRFIMETRPAGVVERMRRRVRKNRGKRVEKSTGHSTVNPMPSIARRAHPKFKPNAPMDSGAVKQGHKDSTQTQRQRNVNEGKVDRIIELKKENNLNLTQLFDHLKANDIDLLKKQDEAKDLNGGNKRSV